jgi:hypothetical protein
VLPGVGCLDAPAPETAVPFQRVPIIPNILMFRGAVQERRLQLAKPKKETAMLCVRSLLVVFALTLPAIAEERASNNTAEVNMWGDHDSIETHEPAVRIFDHDPHVDVWLRGVEGGTVEQDRPRPRDNGYTRKLKDTYTVKPKWPSAEAKSHTVKVEFSWVGRSRRPETGVMTVKFKR